MHSPRTPHLDAINNILMYLKGTPRKRIWMKKMILMQYVAILTQIGHETLIQNQLSISASL
jgi:hypothetical protein